jgi:soluble lytic murein transglycosylase-like protein
MLMGVVLVAAMSSSAYADIYKYQNTDGSVLITTEPRSGLKLLDHVRDSAGSATTTSSKHRKSRAKALAARAAHGGSPGHKGTAREMRFDAIIREASETYQIPFAFIKGVIKVESNFNPLAVSPVGAMGLMQLMPNTASYLGVGDAFDPRQNIFGGAKLLRKLTNRYNGDINLLLSAYNAGEGAVDRYDGIPYNQTREYVRRVYQWYKTYQAGPVADATP